MQLSVLIRLFLQLFCCIFLERDDIMNIHTYTNSSGRDLILEYINSLTDDEKIDAFSVLECMENNEFDKLFYKQWNKKIYEVYFRKHNRLFYITADKNNLYLLHACRKQKNKTEKKDKNIILKRAKELGNLLNKSFI